MRALRCQRRQRRSCCPRVLSCSRGSSGRTLGIVIFGFLRRTRLLHVLLASTRPAAPLPLLSVHLVAELALRAPTAPLISQEKLAGGRLCLVRGSITPTTIISCRRCCRRSSSERRTESLHRRRRGGVSSRPGSSPEGHLLKLRKKRLVVVLYRSQTGLDI